MTSAVRFWVRPYFTSKPTSPFLSLFTAGFARRSLESPAIAYGFSSRFLLPDGASTPTSVPPSEIWKMTLPWFGVIFWMNDSSFFQRTVRRTFTPHTCEAPGL